MKKIVAINDLSGIGRCSLSVALPVISSLKVQCCPFPTSILSSQTNYDHFTFLDLTPEMRNYYLMWKKLNLDFDCIYTGFLGSKEQVDIVSDFINESKPDLIVVDPILGDNGKLYPVFDIEMCYKIKKLVEICDVTTPNLTEACILTGRNFNSLRISKHEILNIAKDISKLGPDKVIITGIVDGDTISNLGYNSKNNEHFFISTKFNNLSYSGTGDIFTSIIAALLIRNFDLKFSIETATRFISSVIEYTSRFNYDRNDGVMFEHFLSHLTSI